MKIPVLFIFCTLLFSQSYSQVKTADHSRKHHEEEQQDDPYLPNKWNNERLSPPYRYVKESKNIARTTSVPTSVFTTQVNVGPGAGQNIIDDAANEPSISRHASNPDIMVIGWRQFDNISSNFRQAGWAYTIDGGQNWTFPGVIQPGIFRSDPVLDYDAFGNIFYNSLTSTTGPVFSCRVFKSDDGGASWDGGVSAFGGDKQWMTIDRTAVGPVNNIYAFWTDAYSICIPDNFTRSVDNGLSYEPCDSVPGVPAFGTLTVDRNGVLYVGGLSNLTGEIVVAKSTDAQNAGQPMTWQPYTVVNLDGTLAGWGPVNPVGLYGQINVDADRSNGPGQDNVYVLGSMQRFSNGDPADVMFASSTDGGQTWNNPVRINDDVSSSNVQWFGTMSVAPTGRIDVVWLDTRDDASGLDMSALYYSYSTDQGVTWSPNEKISDEFDPHLGYPNQDKIGDYFDMESDSLGAHLAWCATFNGEQDVYYSYIQPVITGVNEISPLSSWSIYPNPSEGIFYLTGAGNKANLEIYSLEGKILYTSISDGRHSVIDLSNQPPGIYLLKIVEVDGNISIKKLVAR